MKVLTVIMTIFLFTLISCKPNEDPCKIENQMSGEVTEISIE